MILCVLRKRGRDFQRGHLITLIYFMAEKECQRTAEYSILPVWHTDWAFQKAEENVCSCTVQQWSQMAPFHHNTGCSKLWLNNEGKKMTQMADKDRPCTPLRFLPSTPDSVFNFQSSTRMEEVGKGYSWDRGRREGGVVKEGQQGPGNSYSLGRNRRALKAIYRPRGAWGGGAGSGNSAADTGITNNPTRHPVFLWSWAEGELLWLRHRHQLPICAIKDISIPFFALPQH